jgi:hypothetical protein
MSNESLPLQEVPCPCGCGAIVAHPMEFTNEKGWVVRPLTEECLRQLRLDHSPKTH